MSECNLVFLSYANPDLEIACKIYEGLTKRNLNVWFDKKCRKPGKWRPQIEKAISTSKYFLFCMSKVSLKRADKGEGFQSEEFDFAYNIASAQSPDSFTIIPIRLEDCNRGDLRMTSYNQFDLFEDFDGELDRLAINMGGISLIDKKAKDTRTDDEKHVGSLFGKAEVLNYAENFKDSEKILNVIIALRPDLAEAWDSLGYTLVKLGKYEKAIASHNMAIKLNPNNANFWNNRSFALALSGKSQEALSDSNMAIKLKTDDASGWINRSVALAKLGKLKEGLASLHKAAELNPDYDEVWYNQGIIYHTCPNKTHAN